MDKARVANAKFTTPFNMRLSFPVIRPELIRTSVISLSLFCRPFNVALFIMTVIVDSIQRMFIRRTQADFGKKLIKRGKAKLNTAPTIPFVSFVRRSFTTIFSMIKSSVLRRMPHTVCGGRYRASFNAKATTTFSMSGDNISRVRNRNFATLAFNKPHWLVSLITSGVAKKRQSIKSLTRMVFEIGMSWLGQKLNGILIYKHSVYSFLVNGLTRLVDELIPHWRAVSILAFIPQNLQLKMEAA